MFKRIMIATDGSETSERAAKVGVGLASLSGGEVTAVYVVDVIRLARLPGYAAFPGIKDSILELMLKDGEKATGSVEEIAMQSGVSCSKAIIKGNPSEDILRFSLESGMDLLVMGRVGRSGLNRFLVGSIAEKVVRHSKVPVLMVPGERD
jgi:nucleotide-binding universal stress UspA family protein